LHRGGIYNHFQSKDELALQAFDFAIACVTQQTKAAVRTKHHAIKRLESHRILLAEGAISEQTVVPKRLARDAAQAPIKLKLH
jgi:AcrR family transcriptional regulator